MKLTASMIVRNELGRYLTLVVPHLLEFCDEVRVVDDGSDDGTFAWLLAQDTRVQAVRLGSGGAFAENEGQARQQLFEWTLEGKPSHILAIDSDEFISDGGRVREMIEADQECPVFTLLVLEVWKADPPSLWFREDGGWCPSRAPILYKAPERSDNRWRIAPRKLASGREPSAVVELAQAGQKIDLACELLHFGWTGERERQARYERYVEQDGGEFHANDHIASIMATSGVRLCSMLWPEGLSREALLERVGRL